MIEKNIILNIMTVVGICGFKIAEIEKFEFLLPSFLAATVTILMFCSYIFVLLLPEGRAGGAWLRSNK